MENNHKLALYVSYYLAKYNKIGLTNIGYSNWKNAFADASQKLNVKPNTLRNMRDEFDPIFENRVGWYQRPMSKTRVQVLEALSDLDEYQLRILVKDILSEEVYKNKDEIDQLLKVVSDLDEKPKKYKYISRGPTGRKAEEIFLNYYYENKLPMNGEIVDCRDHGVGYDFKIQSDKNIVFIEVKGISGVNGGILLSNKEWLIAKEMGNDYYLAIISNLNKKTNITLIQNPANRILPKKHVFTTIQVNWTISDKQIKELNA